jgi:hypothetical protein
VDPAGNITETTHKIPDMPIFVMGVNGGACFVTNNAYAEAEKGFWYGAQFSRMLWSSFTFFVGGTIAKSKGRIDDTLNATDMLAFDFGIRKNFYMGRISPFLYFRSGIGFSHNRTSGGITVGPIENGSPFDPVVGFGIGSWYDIGDNWIINLHADYNHVFSADNYPQKAKSFTRIGFGIQEKM